MTPTLARLMARLAARKATEILAGGVPWRKVRGTTRRGKVQETKRPSPFRVPALKFSPFDQFDGRS